jgi:hypothetical protein
MGVFLVIREDRFNVRGFFILFFILSVFLEPSRGPRNKSLELRVVWICDKAIYHPLLSESIARFSCRFESMGLDILHGRLGYRIYIRCTIIRR